MMRFRTAVKLGVNGDILCNADWIQDDTSTIDQSAKSLLRIWENKISIGSLTDSRRLTEVYVAFKWMLGHPDSDTFPGALGLSYAGEVNSFALKYIRRQIFSGEWDALTLEAAEVAIARNRRLAGRSKFDIRTEFMNRVEVDVLSGCWIWRGAYFSPCPKEPRRLPRIYVRRIPKLAKRVGFELFKHPIPAKIQVLVSCGNDACVNPMHMRLRKTV